MLLARVERALKPVHVASFASSGAERAPLQEASHLVLHVHLRRKDVAASSVTLRQVIREELERRARTRAVLLVEAGQALAQLVEAVLLLVRPPWQVPRNQPEQSKALQAVLGNRVDHVVVGTVRGIGEPLDVQGEQILSPEERCDSVNAQVHPDG